jgi:hypothetical protein
MSRAHEWLNYGRSAYSIPVETALVMRGLAGADTRPLEQIFVHGDFVPSGVEAAANDPVAELPGRVDDAIESLPNAVLKVVVREVVERFGGIISRHEFADVFGPRRIHWRSGRFLREYGRRGLGTVGHIDLRTKGIGVEDDALLFFSEVVERHVAEWRERPLSHDRVLSAHGDLLSDARTTLGLIKEFPVRVAKEGAVYKAAKARIAERLQFPEQPFLDREEIADRVLSLVRGLELTHADESGQLKLTEKGEEWVLLPLVKKIEDGYGRLLSDRIQTLRSHHMRRMQVILVDLLKQDDGWWPGQSLAMIARNRYLLELAKDGEPPNRTPLTVLHHALTELGHAAHDLVTRDLFSLGLVDLALRGQEISGVRLSRLGQRLLAGAEAETGDGKPLVVNPDYELLVLPEGDVDDLLHELDRFAARVRTGEVVHYKLDKGRIERATVDGQTADAIVELLDAHARSPVPQNVAYSIRSWAGDVRSATLMRGVVFTANDSSVVEAVLNHPVLKEWVEQTFEPNTVFFNEKVTERQIVQELRSMGVYVQ